MPEASGLSAERGPAHLPLLTQTWALPLAGSRERSQAEREAWAEVELWGGQRTGGPQREGKAWERTAEDRPGRQGPGTGRQWHGEDRHRRSKDWKGSCRKRGSDGGTPAEGSGRYLMGGPEPWRSEGSTGPGGNTVPAAGGWGPEELALALGGL